MNPSSRHEGADRLGGLPGKWEPLGHFELRGVELFVQRGKKVQFFWMRNLVKARRQGQLLFSTGD